MVKHSQSPIYPVCHCLIDLDPLFYRNPIKDTKHSTIYIPTKVMTPQVWMCGLNQLLFIRMILSFKSKSYLCFPTREVTCSPMIKPQLEKTIKRKLERQRFHRVDWWALRKLATKLVLPRKPILPYVFVNQVQRILIKPLAIIFLEDASNIVMTSLSPPQNCD